MRICRGMPATSSLTARLGWLRHLAKHLRSRKGWARALTAFAYGAFSSLAFPPADLTFVLWISFPALIFLLEGTKGMRAAFVTGWCFAFGFLVFDLYWIAAAMFVDIHHFWWAVPLAAFGLPAAFAIYYGVAAALWRKVDLHGLEGALSFALLWFLADYARGHLFTGFPWNIEGYAFAGILPFAQMVSLIGVYGLTFLTLLAAALPAALSENPPSSSARLAFLTSLLVLAGFFVWGTLRLETAPLASVPHVRLRLVQPAIPQADKWKPDEVANNFARLLQLSALPAAKRPTHIIWPETAAMYDLNEDKTERDDVSMIVPPGGALITGDVLRMVEDGGIHFYNALVSVTENARITAVYYKSHLVPFGEYVPYRKWLPLQPVAALGLDFSAGNGPRSLRVVGLPPFSPLICYEAIFPGAVLDPHDRPQFLLNVTNDGWYGRTAGPYQHFAIASMRAIEEGLPLVRDANTGISGVVDAYGRVHARLGLGKEGVVDSDLPVALNEPTYFNRYGEKPLWTFFMLAAAFVFVAAFKRRNR
jgi:apolipoprotein N-acyltransferase